MSSIIEAQTEKAEQEWLESWRRGPIRFRWNHLPLQVGDPAPNVVLQDLSGNKVHLSDSWQAGPAVLVFLRHFGCSCAVDRADRLREEYADYVELGATVQTIGQGEPERSTLFAQQRSLPGPLLCDPARRAYEAYDLLEARPSQVAYGLANEFLRCDYEVAVELQQARHGTPKAPVDSPWQLPGEFVIDNEGIVRLAYRSQYCADFADPEVLNAAIREAKMTKIGPFTRPLFRSKPRI